MKDKYNERGNVVKVSLNYPETELLVDGIVTMSFKNRAEGNEVSLECFLGRHNRIEKWTGVSEGDSIEVRLALLNFEYNRILPRQRPVKTIAYKRNCKYKIAGQILELEAHPRYEDSLAVILDCGVYIQTRVGKNVELKVGDYISAEGRLDAHIVGKVN